MMLTAYPARHLSYAITAVAHITLVLCQQLDNGNLCHLVTLLPFTDERPSIVSPHNDPEISYGFGQWPNQETLAKASFSLLAAAEMAIKHFNERDTSIVPELATLGDCNIQLDVVSGDGDSSWVFDSGYSRSKTIRTELPLISSSLSDKICTFIGPVYSHAQEGLSVLAENINVPQLGFATIDGRLEEKPTVLRMIPAAQDLSKGLAALFRDVWKREYIAIVYDQSDYGEQFENSLEDVANDYGYHTVSDNIIEGDDESIYNSLSNAKHKGFRTIVLITDRPAFLNDIATIADELDMLGDNDYMWIISGAAFPRQMRDVMKYEVDSPTDKMLRGAALFTNYDPFIYKEESDRFLRSWREQDGTNLIEKVIDHQPVDVDGQKFYIPQSLSTYFSTVTPSEYASFIYDSVVATGIGACKGISNTDADIQNAHYSGIKSTAFHGASGRFSMKSNTRDPKGTLMGLYNVRPSTEVNENKRSYETVLTSIWDSSHTSNAKGEKVDGGAWANVDGTEFIFFDGTTNEPMPLRTVSDEHFISQHVQIAGLFISSFAMFLCILTGLFVFVNWENKHIKSIQPEFCVMLCFGATLVAAALIFVSFDESTYSQQRLSSMCTAAPWFFVTGYLTMFCAVFSQLWRLSKVLSIRRQKVKIAHVMKPFGIIICSSIIILSVWTAIDPFVWVRKITSGIDEDGEKDTDEPLETYGQCASEQYGILPFIIPLGFLFALVIGLTAIFSWKLKSVSAELTDSKFIFFGILSHIQTWLLGVPILIITNNVSKDAFYLMLAALAFIFSVSLPSMVILPKAYLVLFGVSSSPRASVSLSRGNTHISGLNLDPETTELKTQVSKLMMQLKEKESEVRRLSLSIQQGAGSDMSLSTDELLEKATLGLGIS